MEKVCRWCSRPMPSGKRPQAVYCTRKCKQAAAEQRRPQRDHAARYIRERERRLAYATEPTRMREAARKRRALKRARTSHVVTARDWTRLKSRYHHKCAYCQLSKPLTLEHVVPLSMGGLHSIGNILPACATCNSSKRDRFITEWRMRIPSPHQRRRRECDTQGEMAI